MKPIDIYRANSRRRKPGKFALLRERRSIESKYFRSMKRLLRTTEAQVKQEFVRRQIITDAEYVGVVLKDISPEDFQNSFTNLRALIEGTADTVTDTVREFTNEADEVHRQRFFKSLERSFGVDIQGIINEEGLTDVINGAVSENVSLVKSLPNSYLDQLEQAVFRNFAQGGGGTQAAIEDMLRQSGAQIRGKLESRAKLIARDQNAKLNSRLTRERQTALGVTQYIWVTSRDERVRPTHHANRNKVFRWDSPPPATGHPGEDIQCRCIAQPVL